VARLDLEHVEWLDRMPIGRPYRAEIDAILRRTGRRGGAAPPEEPGGAPATLRPSGGRVAAEAYVPEPGSRCLATNAAAWARRWRFSFERMELT